MWKKLRKNVFIGFIIVSIYLLVPCMITLAVTGVVGQSESEELISGRRVIVKSGNVTKTYEVNKFIAMVLASRWDISKEMEVLKAQSIMVRTDIYRMMGEEYSIDSDKLQMPYLTERQMKNKWGESFEINYNLIMDCVNSTTGTVITYNGQLIEAKMQEVSGGKTLSGSMYLGENYAYLAEVECTQDIQSPNFLRVVTFSNKEFVKKIKNAYQDVVLDESNPLGAVQIVSKSESGYVIKIQVGNVVLSGGTLANILGINSSCMMLEKSDEGVKITTKGVGDGFGVSLYYADYMAKNGNSYEEILARFYSKTTLAAW
ncbi:MAG: SpoIID/LytB domain-containing protein [Lachnospira sp.]|nr:SpoIID/LytB domain-containing protein [Lachnospira sp.]